MSGKSHMPASATSSDVSAGPMQEGAQDFGSNAAMQDEMLGATASADDGPMKLPIIGNLPDKTGDNSFVSAFGGKNKGIQRGWRAESENRYFSGSVNDVFANRCKVFLRGEENSEGQMERPTPTGNLLVWPK